MGEQPQASATGLGPPSSVDHLGLLGEQPQASATGRLAREFAAVVSLPEAPDSMCLSVLLDGEPIYEHRAGVALVPASLMKIVTAAAAVEVLGPAHTYTTEVHVRSDALKSAEGGVLSGDIYVVGRGDPVLSTPGYVDRHSEPVVHTDVTELAERVSETLVAHGIGTIDGRVVGDSSWFGDDEHDYSRHVAPAGTGTVWRPSDVAANHSGPLSGLLVDDGFSSYPPSTVGGRRLNVRATEPARHAASVFADSLAAEGIVAAGKPQSGAAPPQAETASLGSIESPRLSEILARMLSLSDNTTSEMLFKEIGRRTSGSARAQAAAAVQDVIDRVLGPVAAGNVIVDGSGLSLHNRLTCPAVSALLALAGPGSPLVEGLSAAGESGSLSACPAVAAQAGAGGLNEVRAKTGVHVSSTALAGLAVAANGQTVTFAMIANGPDILRLGYCNRLWRGLLNAAAGYTYGPAAPSVSRFVDVGPGVHAGAIEALAEAGITFGCDGVVPRFCPDEPASRAQMASLLARALGLAGGSGGSRFVDVRPGVHAGAIEALAEAGISFGCDGVVPRFCPDEPASRAQVASLLARALGLAGGSGGSRFVDVRPGVHAGAIEALAEAGITFGCDGVVPRFCPDEPASRAQVASLLARALGLSGDPKG